MRRTCLFVTCFVTLLLVADDRALAEKYNPTIDPANFTTTIDNPFFPLTPGTTYTYRGTTDAGAETETLEVTDSTRKIMGVRTVEVIDTVFVNGALQEFTRDWYAQDRQGNVW